MSSIIQVTDLSKSFTISHEGQKSYTTLRDTIGNKTKKLFSFPFKLSGAKQQASSKEEFWALKNINFEIERGDRVGIIGRNGAGKSTLLKILSRITEPTSGEIRIRGRVASLLEVGTGFHPELTGRENIFLNGAILGMSRAEIKRKFDEIVDFAEVEKFLDTPVKRYSSGMYVRLAFAVAAHLEPEILIVDEVLAVGDAQFQKKCLGKMEDVSKNEGRTVLFVSHNTTAIASLCTRALLIQKGTIIDSGETVDVLSNYFLGDSGKSSVRSWMDDKNLPGNDVVKLKQVRMIDANHYTKDTFDIDEKIGIEMTYEVFVNNHILWQGHNLFNSEGINIFDTHNVKSQAYKIPHPKGTYKSIAWIPANLMASGTFIVSSAIFNHTEHIIYFHEKDVVIFNVIDTYSGETSSGLSLDSFPGIVRPLLDWDIIEK